MKRRAAIASRALAFAFAAVSVLSSAAAQTLGQGATDDVSIWRILLALALCFILALGGALALKPGFAGRLPFSLSRAARNRRLTLVDTLRLTHQVDLCIVSCDGKELLLASSASGVRLLRDLSPARQETSS